MDTEWIFQFVVKVWWARKHAKAWYQNHSQYDLIQAKRYEAEVDAALRKLLTIENGEPKELNLPEEQPRQADMFAEDEEDVSRS